MSDVVVKEATKTFGNTKAVEKLSIEIQDGEFMSLLGPSGCGKTTLLRLIAGLVLPEQGNIFIGGKCVDQVPTYERNLAMVFQNYSLFPHMTVADNVNFGLKIRGVSSQEAKRRIGRALELVRLPGYEGRYPRQLSGGQQQRVALARAIVYEPDVLLLDEPFGALDRKLRGEMQIELKTLQRELGITTIFVTHDQEEALTISHRIAVMNGGHIEQVDSPEGIYERPASSFVSDFIGITNLLSGSMTPCNGSFAFETERGLIIPWITASAPGPARLSIRPENIELLHTQVGGGIPGKVEEKVYLGANVHYYVSFDTGDRMIVIQSAQKDKNVKSELGDEVMLRWQAQDIILLKN